MKITLNSKYNRQKNTKITERQKTLVFQKNN